jgi:hypothetical protein
MPPTPNYEVTRIYKDERNRDWVTVQRIMFKDRNLDVPAFACLHDSDEGRWRLSRGRHVFIHQETIRFYSQPTPALPDIG